jgi:hypothetical protein
MGEKRIRRSRESGVDDWSHRPPQYPNSPESARNGGERLAVSPARRGNRDFALGRLRPGEMNKTETEYDLRLDAMKHHGEIAWYCFEGIKLRLADATFYTPDFVVMASDGVIECHEVKGFWRDEARVKIKVAAALYPFRFIAARKRTKAQGDGFDLETFG